MRTLVGFSILLRDLKMTNRLAHVRRNEDGSFAIHELEDHLRAVGDLGEEEPR